MLHRLRVVTVNVTGFSNLVDLWVNYDKKAYDDPLLM